MQKLIVILGPTASGKSELAVKLAKKFNGEVVSADSRQVYKGMDIGTGKVSRDRNLKLEIRNWKLYYHRGIPHHLLDVASPKRRYTVAQYKKAALKAIEKIYQKNKIPILCGGTGFYIQAVVDGLIIPEVKPDWKLRKKLGRKTTEELFEQLEKSDPDRAKIIDQKNRRRLIRALEIVIKTGQPVPKLKKEKPKFDVLLLGVKKSTGELKKLIKKRLLKRMRPRTRTSPVRGKQGMLTEVKKLKKSGLSWQRLEDFGLEYRWLARYLQKNISYKEMLSGLQKDIEHFAKRQMTWFKRDKKIKWIRDYRRAEMLVRRFLSSRACRGIS